MSTELSVLAVHWLVKMGDKESLTAQYDAVSSCNSSTDKSRNSFFLQ